MPRRLFKKLNRKRHHLHGSWFMKPFAFVFADSAFWSLNRRNVTRAVALGFFIAFMPPVFPHTIIAVALAVLLRLNVPVTLTAIFINNPITIVPMYYAAYRVGCWALGVVALDALPEMTAQSWRLALQGHAFLKPLLLGCVMLGTLAATTAFVVIGSLWHLSLVNRYHRRKQARLSRKAPRKL